MALKIFFDFGGNMQGQIQDFEKGGAQLNYMFGWIMKCM